MTEATRPESTRHPLAPYARVAAPRAALAGLVAGGLAIGAAELLAGVVIGAPSLVNAVGDLLIAIQPAGAKQVVVDLFGTADKLAVSLLIVAVALALGGAFGLLARRSWPAAIGGFGAVGALLVFAALREPLVTKALAVLVPVAATGLAVATCGWLLRLALPPAEAPVEAARLPEPSRRRFLSAAGGVAVAAVAAGFAGRRLLDSAADAAAAPAPAASGASIGTAPGGLPVPAASTPPVPAGAEIALEGITPLVVPNGDFYRIDTALAIPSVDAATWSLTVKGMVEREITFSYKDLLALPQFEQYVTIACVSNEVGGDLVGNAKWQGVHLRSVLEMAGVKPGATQIVGRSVDDFTAGFPTAWAMDPARDPMIALGMNGVPLPVLHGFPARLIIPGLYGYVSATKWLKEIELTTWEAFNGYWVPLGWSKEAPILTQSRVDTPRRGARLKTGTIPIGGVAWAPDRGVSRVEVRIQGGAWEEARISAPLGDAAWVQWRFDWEATAPGVFDIAVRATDATGAVQEERVTEPAPDGARGYHRVQVEVSG